MRLLKITVACAVMSLVFLSGCQTDTYQRIDKNNQEAATRIASVGYPSEFQYVKHSSKWYVPKVKQARINMPDWCFSPQQVGVFKSTPMKLVIEALTENIAVNVQYGPNVNEMLEISIPNNRDVCDGLDKISLASGYSYEVNDAKITFKALEDRVVDVTFAPGQSKYFMGNEKDSQSGSNDSGQGQLVSVKSDSLAQSSAFKGVEASLNPWENLLVVLNQMKSKNGFIGPNQVASNVLLRDTPERVDAMEKYIKNLNRAVNRVISIEIELIEVTTNEGDSNSLNVQNLIKSINGNKGAISLGTNLGSQFFSDSNSPLLDIAYTKPANGDSESLLIQALKKHGKVSVSRKQRLITLNNQIVKIKDVVNNTYLAQSKKDSTANVGATDELIPGSVQSGLDLYALAREYDGNIQFHLTANISNLTELGEVTSGTSKIQTPSVAEKEFDTMALIPANMSLLLTGMSTSRNETDYSGTVDDQSGLWPFSDLLGYSRASKNQKTETIILVTAGLVYKEN
jgi:type IVB pilus formation R64 PilN family outer membrane protein